jgi:uncharacterized protein (DUF58 family)
MEAVRLFDIGQRWLDRAAKWVKPRRVESLPAALDRHRIYTLPTRFGLFLAALLSTMLLGALNYNNNPALLLGFLLAASAQLSLHVTHLSLSGVRLRGARGTPVHAGEAATLELRLDAIRARSRTGLVLECGDARTVFALTTADPVEVALALPTATRGWMHPGRIKLSTTQPFGLARSWAWFWPDVPVLVYPALEPHAPPLPLHDGPGARARVRAQGEEPHHLRDYRSGDPPRQVAWKPSARIGKLLVREYQEYSDRELVLDWNTLAALPYETRVSRLARWVVEADRIGARYTLVLPAQKLGPAQGHLHRHSCLQALALLPSG